MKNLSTLSAAEQERYAELLDLTERREYNLTPLLHLLTMECHPFNLSERLLAIHFALSYHLAHDPEECGIEGMHNNLYTLQRLYAVLRLIEPEKRELFEKSKL